ncbi:uracil-DNA glycosylase-like [Tubulanus polymorphus]|uniref:uracil-DNA glycosylase-like n=1 Tax=Tubulanus polymorphus TaxID=672921 RepID=UPI003DA532AA
MMSGQSKISTFFSPLRSAKRSLSSTENIETPKNKKRNEDKSKSATTPEGKAADHVSGDENCGPISLSPEQKQRIDQNRLSAAITMCKKKTNGLVDNIGPSWFSALEKEFSKPYFLRLSSFVQGERQKVTVYPPINQVFSWTQMSDINDVKVVILGQDPYHGPHQAHGLCFSVQKGVSAPPSLINIFKELKNDIADFEIPNHGDLTGWARQGVLLLNAVLTVKAANANSHKDKGWEQFTDAVIKYLSNSCTGLVFILWGSYAQKKGAIINKKKHHILTGVHPSPLSAHRGYFGCKHFSKTNEFLAEMKKEPINWNNLP